MNLFSLGHSICGEPAHKPGVAEVFSDIVSLLLEELGISQVGVNDVIKLIGRIVEEVVGTVLCDFESIDMFGGDRDAS